MSIVLFGGTFDPVHNGHIQTAIKVQQTFHFDRFIFLPCKQPLLKTSPSTTAHQRLAMLQLALEDCKQYPFEIDPVEIERSSPSYTLSTLLDYRARLGKTHSISLLLGMDAFIQLPKWYQWEKIITLSHLIIMQRPSYTYPCTGEIDAFLRQHETPRPELLPKTAGGLIYRFNAGEYALSSSMIRKQCYLMENQCLAVPMKVAEYIRQNKLYTQP